MKTFAYGMNMYPETMPDDATGEAAWLDGYRLAWRGYADVEPTEDDTMVPGVLWTLPNERALRALDRREGVPHLYWRELVPVATRSGQEEMAWLYRMTPATVCQYEDMRLTGLSTCSDHYLFMVERGRLAFGHPTNDLTPDR